MNTLVAIAKGVWAWIFLAGVVFLLGLAAAAGLWLFLHGFNVIGL